MNTSQPQKITIEIYSKADCHLCDDAKAVLKRVNKKRFFELIEIDITKRADLFEKYKEEIPVIFINGKKAFKYRITESGLIKKLRHIVR